MANKYDLKTVYRSITSGSSGPVYIVTNDISTTSAVPAGKTRFLTYIRLERNAPASIGSLTTGYNGVIASLATASNVTSYASAVSGGGKLSVDLLAVNASTGSAVGLPEASLRCVVPKRPSMDNPILSVAGGSCMVFYHSSGPAVHLYAQYYDE